MADTMKCDVCFRQCDIKAGAHGACFSRVNDNGCIIAKNYGRITGLALDPIEKKPLYRFYPGNMVLSVGSYGCNLKCPFCQNVDISLADGRNVPYTEYLSPEKLCELADAYRFRGNIGVAYTYNEPLTAYEYVRDCAKLIHEAGMKNVLVTNGSASAHVLEEISPYIDAMNIDLKSFDEAYYRDVLKGDLETVKAFITEAVSFCHVELTTLIIPGENDSDEKMREEAAWIHELEINSGKKIPLHITRFFPRSSYSDRSPTAVESIYHLADIAREKLEFVYEGNV